LIFRRLANATHVTKVIASVGLNIALFGLAFLQFGLDQRYAKPILPSGTVRLWGTAVPYDRFWFVGIAAAAGCALWAVFRWTRFGMATRASAENQKGAELMGLSPRFLSSVNWMLASVVAGAAGILAAPVRGVTLLGFGAYLAFGLAAALAARLRSFAVATIAGVSLGMFEALSVHLKATGKVPSFLQGGFETAVPFVVIVGVLLLFGTNLPTRGVILDDRNPLSPAPRFNPYVLVPAIGGSVYVLGFARSGLRLALIQSLIVAVLTLALVLMAGFVGQVTLAEMTFAGIGAFTLARFADRNGLGFPWSPLLAVTVTTVIATIISFPAVRIRGLQFAIVTFSGAIALEQVLFRNPKFTGVGGAAKVPAPDLFGKQFGIGSGTPGGTNVYPYKPFGFFSSLPSCARCSSPTCGAPPWAAGCWPCGPTSGRRPPRASMCRAPSCSAPPWVPSSLPAPACCGRTASRPLTPRASRRRWRWASSRSPTSAALPWSAARSSPACSRRPVSCSH
jgi:branched-chain amino acid transport system permease protein